MMIPRVMSRNPNSKIEQIDHLSAHTLCWSLPKLDPKEHHAFPNRNAKAFFHPILLVRLGLSIERRSEKEGLRRLIWILLHNPD